MRRSLDTVGGAGNLRFSGRKPAGIRRPSTGTRPHVEWPGSLGRCTEGSGLTLRLCLPRKSAGLRRGLACRTHLHGTGCGWPAPSFHGTRRRPNHATVLRPSSTPAVQGTHTHTQAPRVLRPDRRALCACDFAAVLLDRFGGSCPTREGPGRAGFPLGVAGASGRAVPPLFPALAGRRTPRVFEGSPRPGRAVCRVVYPPSLSGETEKPLLADPAVRYRARGAVLGRFLRTAVLGFSSEVAARVLSPGVSCSAVPEPRLTFLSHSGGSKLRGEEEPGEAAPALSHSRAQTRPCLHAHPTYPQGVTSASVWLVGYRLRRSACRSDRSIYI